MNLSDLLSRCDPQHSPPAGNHHPPSLYLRWHQHQLPAWGLPRWLQGSPAGGEHTQGAAGLRSSALHHCSAPFTERSGQPEVRMAASLRSWSVMLQPLMYVCVCVCCRVSSTPVKCNRWELCGELGDGLHSMEVTKSGNVYTVSI